MVTSTGQQSLEPNYLTWNYKLRGNNRAYIAVIYGILIASLAKGAKEQCLTRPAKSTLIAPWGRALVRARFRNLPPGSGAGCVQTVEQHTHVPINHYAAINFTHVGNVIKVVGGVNATLPETTKAFGYTFPAGVNHLDGLTAVYYARQPSLTEEGRVLRQQSLFRAVADRLANAHLLTNPITMYRVIDSFTSLLTVDANLTNSDVVKFATQFSVMNSRSRVFLTAPTYTVAGKTYLNSSLADLLWTAIRQDSIAAFAKEYPSTVTPAAPH